MWKKNLHVFNHRSADIFSGNSHFWILFVFCVCEVIENYGGMLFGYLVEFFPWLHFCFSPFLFLKFGRMLEIKYQPFIQLPCLLSPAATSHMELHFRNIFKRVPIWDIHKSISYHQVIQWQCMCARIWTSLFFFCDLTIIILFIWKCVIYEPIQIDQLNIFICGVG